MLVSDCYQNYIGPPLIYAVLDEVDVTTSIQEHYGEKKNWNGCLWTFKEMFGDKCYGKHFRLDFKSEDGREHYQHGFINNINEYMNPPMATPVNQDPKYWENLAMKT